VITADLIRDLIVGHDASRPRSKQRAIGPSDLSSPCNRKLAYQILGVPRASGNQVNLYSYVGTGLHRQLQDACDRHPDRWLTEFPVSVPVTEQVAITGHGDAYDRETFSVVDWKSRGASRPSSGTRDKHHTQLLPYALGLILQGHRVDHCAVVYIPRNGHLTDIEVDSRPFDHDAAERLLRRYEALLAAAAAGPSVLPMLPVVDDCTFCSWWKPGSDDLAAGCPGANPKDLSAPSPWEPNESPQQKEAAS
jgi:hypothetical protein